jgi:uncharacterized cupredoxin-like copper-binding protein
MTHNLRLLAFPVALCAAAGLIAAGCGGGDETTTVTETAATGGAAAGGNSLEIKMGDFFFDPKNGSAPSGPTTIEAPNEGSVEHELVVFKSDMNPANLPTESNGDVDEEKMDQEAEEKGEIPDVEPGETKSEDFELTPGKYVIFCNLPGHYAQGMYGTITVTE